VLSLERIEDALPHRVDAVPGSGRKRQKKRPAGPTPSTLQSSPSIHDLTEPGPLGVNVGQSQVPTALVVIHDIEDGSPLPHVDRFLHCRERDTDDMVLALFCALWPTEGPQSSGQIWAA